MDPLPFDRMLIAPAPGAMQPLRAWRLAQQRGLGDVAETAGVTAQTLTDLEAGRRRPNYGTMRAISRVLGVAPHQITEFASAIHQWAMYREVPAAAD
jgi:transcriptional regulator with XRE-family HTH domain